jgi:ribosomal protein S18 acetylase RimI-like enzyme
VSKEPDRHSERNCVENTVEKIRLVAITKDHLAMHMKSYLKIGEDVSPWRAENFLTDLPKKWDLSFSFWTDIPLAYCIMSARGEGVHIHHFMVMKGRRGEGIGAAMLRQALRLANGIITLKIDPENFAARRFYERYGFEFICEENGYLLLANRMPKLSLR